MFICYAFLGILLALIGMNIMHDRVHGAYTKSRIWNAVLEFSLLFIGSESAIWKIEHNMLHHGFTNVEEIDQDINPRFLFRFSSNQPLRWFHRFQAFYAPLLYGLLLFEWLSIKDFMKIKEYSDLKLISTRRKAWILGMQIFIKKLIFHCLFLGIPLWLIPVSSWFIILGYCLMLFIGGLLMTLIFQLAHVVPLVQFSKAETTEIKTDFFSYQLLTTANFATQNKFVNWIFGGLNHQIEHHLFPGICHVHYPSIAPLVEESARRFGLPYYSNESLFTAIKAHFHFLRTLGKA